MADTEDRKLVAVFQQVADFVGESLLWRPLHQQHTNRIWRSVFRHPKLVLRVNANTGRAFGVSRSLERQVLEAVQPYPWGPKVLHNDVENGWCLLQDHGPTLADLDDGTAQAQAKAIRRELLGALSDMQCCRNIPAFNYANLLELYAARLLQVNKRAQWSQFARLKQLIETFGQDRLALVHHDLHPGNICWDAEKSKLTIIDWEYAGVGNGWLDLAQLIKSQLLEIRDIVELPLLQSLQESIIQDRLELADEVNGLLESLWIAVRDNN